MNKLILTALILLAPTASAQQKLPVTSAPVTIDGVTTLNGLVTVNGKSYVSLDALRARGLTLLGSGSLGLYNFTTGKNLPVKLSGCRNEWLTDSINRVRFQAINTNNGRWTVHFQFQTTRKGALLQSFLQGDKIVTVLQDGTVLDPSKNPFERTEILSGYTDPGETTTATFVLSGADLVDENPPVKIMVRPSGKAAVQGTWTFDLSCQK